MNIKATFPQRIGIAAGVLAIVGILAWSYGSSFEMLLRVWEEPDYSHGYLVPFFSAFLLWHRRDMIPARPWRGAWWGAALIAFSGAFYWG